MFSHLLNNSSGGDCKFAQLIKDTPKGLETQHASSPQQIVHKAFEHISEEVV
jgi:hypothetical protein